MIIEDPESFKTWLTLKLEPLCDADPAALAKYVYALVKKDKPVEELRASMLGQLEVFLQGETQVFVNLLFKTLETQVFDATVEEQQSPTALPAPPVPKTVADVDLRNTLPISNSHEETEKKTSKEPNAAILASAQNSNSLGCVLLATATGRREQGDRHLRKTDSDKEERNRRGRRRGSSASPSDRRRSRSRSFERRRSRSRERDRARAWRNKSPPLRRYERRRSYSKSPVRRYSKSRSPQSKRIRYRNRSPPRSRSRTPIATDIRKDVAAGISPRESSHGDLDLRLPPSSQNIQSVVAVPPDLQSYSTARRCRDFDEKGFCMRGDLCPYDHGSDPVILEDVPSLYNGGAAQASLLTQPPPPSLTNTLRHPATTHPSIRPPPPPPPPLPIVEYNPDTPGMEPRVWSSRPTQFRSGLIARGIARAGIGRGAFPQHQRELINVVTGPHFRHQRPSLNLNSDVNNARMNSNDGIKNSGFENNRLGGANPRLSFSQKGGNTTLQLKKVPQGANNITHLNNHFSKFGKIINIQVGFEGDPESALITFSSHTEANIAYKSTEAVLNNRFIRVYWYNPTNNNNNNNNNNSGDNKQENNVPTTRPSALDRLGAPPTKVLNNIQPSAVQQAEKVTLVNNNLSKTLYIPTAIKKDPVGQPLSANKEQVGIINNLAKTLYVPTAIKKDTIAQALSENKEQINEELKKKLEEVSLAKKKQEEARKAGIKLNADLRKRKQELLEKQLNQQKLLIQRMETSNITQQQKSTLMATIKTLQESIEKIQKDLEHSVKANLTKVSKRNSKKEHQALIKKTREEIQRELLDAELDLINRQHEGKDADDLKKKVADLKLKAYSLGISSVRGSYRGGRGTIRIRGRGRGAKFLSSISYDHNVVDHRPTKVLISGYEQDDKADVLAHFEQYGMIIDYISDDATPSLVLNYKSRKEAEQAITKGRNFHDRVLSVTWATHNNSIRGGIPQKPATPILRSVMVMEEDEMGEDILEGEDEEELVGGMSPDFLLHEDEEDEDEEDRTWRR